MPDPSNNQGGTPPVGGDLHDPLWQRWFQSLYDTVLGDGGSFPKLTITNKGNKAVADNTMLDQQLLHWTNGHYVDYTTQSGTIAYGYACAVRRQAGNSFTVGAQIDAIGGRGSGSNAWVFGLAVEAISEYKAVVPTFAAELTAACLDDNNINAKWGCVSVFKNRSDLTNTVPYGIGANLFNHQASAYIVSAQSRSGAGEFCGWGKGILFFGTCFDTQTAPAWSASVTYNYGQMVTSGGRVWQCKLPNTNQVPATPGNYWDWFTPGAGGQPANAVGIDFTAIEATSASRMASAIRLRDFMRLHWDVTGAIGTYFDSTTGNVILVENNGTKVFEVGVSGPNIGLVFSKQPEVALGGGAGATLGTVGGAGPGVAGQNGWWPISINGAVRWVPTWQ